MGNKPIYVRIDDDLRGDFEKALETTDLTDAQFVKAAIKAFVEYVREHEEIRLPLAIIPKSQLRGKDASVDPPGKSPAGFTRRTAGREDVGAARGENQSTGFQPSSRLDLNEDAPQEIQPVIPAREKSPKPRVTRARAALREMHQREHKEGK